MKNVFKNLPGHWYKYVIGSASVQFFLTSYTSFIASCETTKCQSTLYMMLDWSSFLKSRDYWWYGYTIWTLMKSLYGLSLQNSAAGIMYFPWFYHLKLALTGIWVMNFHSEWNLYGSAVIALQFWIDLGHLASISSSVWRTQLFVLYYGRRNAAVFLARAQYENQKFNQLINLIISILSGRFFIETSLQVEDC